MQESFDESCSYNRTWYTYAFVDLLICRHTQIEICFCERVLGTRTLDESHTWQRRYPAWYIMTCIGCWYDWDTGMLSVDPEDL